MKRTIMILLSIIIFSGATTSFAGECGDVDGTPPVNILDIVHLINYKYKEGPKPDCGTVTDYDGNEYKTVTIGDQVWMAENLKVTHYRNGDPIPIEYGFAQWELLTTGAYCNYNNDAGYVGTYGRLYNWFAVDDIRGLAPEGWHIPTDEEWKQLEMYLGMSQEEADGVGNRGTDEGGKLKEVGTEHWENPNVGATNETGFTALPAGYRYWDNGVFAGMIGEAFFWTSTEGGAGNNAWGRYIDHSQSNILRYDIYLKQIGFPVRCVKD